MPPNIKAKAIIKTVAEQDGVSEKTVWRAWHSYGAAQSTGRVIDQ